MPAFPLVRRRASAPSLRPSARAARGRAPPAGATAVNARAKTRPASSYRRSGSVRSSWRVERWYSLAGRPAPGPRSEEHTSELQSRLHLVCRLLLEKKKKKKLTDKLHEHVLSNILQSRALNE